MDDRLEEQYYKTQEVAELLDVSPRMVRDWIYKIEKRTDFRFSRKIDMKTPWYVNGEPRPQLFLSGSDVELLQKIKEFQEEGFSVLLAIDKIFLLPEDFEKMYPSDMQLERE
ncbi:MAG TPA: helix-turn-helix domain-containing protein [Enterococcus hirae]|nr:helix-turn-helix domain-containing protein [Enterococcus hirae]